MAFIDAYDTKTGKKLPYLVPEWHFDHPVLGKRIARLPSDVAREQARDKRAAKSPRGAGRTRPVRPEPVAESDVAPIPEPVTQAPAVTVDAGESTETPDVGDN